MRRSKSPIHVRWIVAIEENQQAPVFVFPAPDELNKDSLRLSAWDVVVVYANRLAGDELVSRDVYLL